MMMRSVSLFFMLMMTTSSSLSNAFVVVVHPKMNQQQQHSTNNKRIIKDTSSSVSSSSLQMVDNNVLMGGGIALAGLVAGIGLVAFTEQQGERAKERGGGLSDNMTTRIAGKLMEDVEVSSVDDLGSLTSQLEKALATTAAAKNKDTTELNAALTMTEEDIKRKKEEADDGW